MWAGEDTNGDVEYRTYADTHVRQWLIRASVRIKDDARGCIDMKHYMSYAARSTVERRHSPELLCRHMARCHRRHYMFYILNGCKTSICDVSIGG